MTLQRASKTESIVLGSWSTQQLLSRFFKVIEIHHRACTHISVYCYFTLCNTKRQSVRIKVHNPLLTTTNCTIHNSTSLSTTEEREFIKLDVNNFFCAKEFQSNLALFCNWRGSIWAFWVTASRSFAYNIRRNATMEILCLCLLVGQDSKDWFLLAGIMGGSLKAFKSAWQGIIGV